MKRVLFHPAAILNPRRPAASSSVRMPSHFLLGLESCSFSFPKSISNRGFSNSSASGDNNNGHVTEPTHKRRGGRPRARNFRLEEVKSVGMSNLEQTAKDASVKASKPLFVSEEDEGPTAKQIKEASRIHQMLDEAIDSYSKRDATFTIRGDPITILDVEVSKDLKYARCYWTLPFTLVELPDETRTEVKRRMQTILEKRGGRLQALVHAKLRFYYPPKLRFVPAEDDVLSMAMKDLLR